MNRSRSRGRGRACASAVAVVAIYGVAIYLTSLSLPLAWGLGGLRVALAVFLVQSAVLLILTLGICLVKIKAQVRRLKAAVREHAIQRIVASLAAGERSRLKLEPAWMEHSEELASHLEVMLLTTKGEAWQRLSRLVSEIGLTAYWLRESLSSNAERRGAAVRRLGLIEGFTILDRLHGMIADPDPAVRVGVYRSLLRLGRRAEDTEEVFNAVVDESLLIRALLNNELAKHAIVLGERVLPQALTTTDPDRLIRILDMAGAWKRMVALPGLRELLLNPDPEVQHRVLTLLPYIADEAEAAEQIEGQAGKLSAVLSGLQKGSEQVMIAAAAASGYLQMESAIPFLVTGLRAGTPRISRSYAEALARLGSNGVRALEAEILNCSTASASAALEALERAGLGQLARGVI